MNETDPGSSFDRRAFFGRLLMATGATAVVLTTAGCPGGEQDDEGDDEGDDD